MKWSRVMLLAVPLALGAALLRAGPVPELALSALALIPLAALIGEATEELAARTGPVIGGLLNATLGNAAELIIALAGIRAGLLDLVKASITGSILGNMLLVMGLSLLVGGWCHGVQRFSRQRAGVLTTMTVLAFIALGIPSLFSHTIAAHHPEAVETLSLGVAGLMLALYILSVLYTLRAREPLGGHAIAHARWTLPQALGILALATLGVVIMSEILVHALEPAPARPGPNGVLRWDHPHPSGRQCGGAPGGRPDGGREPDGPLPGDRGRLQPADRPAGGPRPGLRQPGPGAADGPGLPSPWSWWR